MENVQWSEGLDWTCWWSSSSFLLIIFFSRPNGAQCAHSSSRQLADEYTTPKKQQDKKRTTPRYKMEKKKKKSLAFSITFSVPGCVCVCHEIAAADVLFRLSSRRRVYNISAQDYFSKNTFIPCWADDRRRTDRRHLLPFIFFALIHSEAAGAVLGWSDKMRAKKKKTEHT